VGGVRRGPAGVRKQLAGFGRAAPLATVVGMVGDHLAGKGKKAAARVFGGNSTATYEWVRR
jgi:hypothetical protein